MMIQAGSTVYNGIILFQLFRHFNPSPVMLLCKLLTTFAMVPFGIVRKIGNKTVQLPFILTYLIGGLKTISALIGRMRYDTLADQSQMS